MIRQLFKIVSAVLLLLTIPSFSSYADQEFYFAPSDPNLNPYATDSEAIINDGYVIPTFKNLSKLYWALAMLDLGDNQAIDNFLKINQCDLYTKYYNNDFELEELREVTRQSITKNISNFPLKFEIMIPVGIERYNTGTEKFMLDTRSQFVGARRLEIAVNNELEATCSPIIQEIPKYPRNFILSLSRPLTVTDVPVDPDVAQIFMENMEKEMLTHQYRYSLSQFSRVAYLRLTVTMNMFKGYSKPDAQTPSMAEIFGTIDGFEMYGDRDKTLLMYNKKIAKERAARVGPKTVQVPSGQLIESYQLDSVGNIIPPHETPSNISSETGSEEPRFDIPSVAPPVRAPTPAPKAQPQTPAPKPAQAPVKAK